ncbi:MAG: 30S ribosomal protein S16 [Fimbriimonadaceae bacterium]
MVKIRLQRLGNKGRPFYRIVVAKSTAARNSRVIETIGHYNPISQPKQITIQADRALHWLLSGAQPTETTAYLLNKQGVLESYFAQRPAARSAYKFLDKASGVVAAPTAVEAPVAVAEPEPAPAPEPVVEETAVPAEESVSGDDSQS